MNFANPHSCKVRGRCKKILVKNCLTIVCSVLLHVRNLWFACAK